MWKHQILTLLTAACLAASLVSCADGRPGDATQSNSTIPDRKCNPALVTNPVFLNQNEGIAGAGGPDLPGAEGATGSNCQDFNR
ncbi:MAG TPA: hypothetical protein VKT70_13130 [Stellaceae bacterium]|nr:hypothetical protein [Stellaceae bacterium]